MVNPLAELVEGAARNRRDSVVPRDYIIEAIELVESGNEKVTTYPTGIPTLQGIYDLASRLYQNRA